LFDLVNAAKVGIGIGARTASESVPPVLQRVLDAITEAPAIAINARLDILIANGSATRCSIKSARSIDQSSVAQYIFLDPRSFEFFVDWDLIAEDAVALLRAEAGRNRSDPKLSALVGELSTQSEVFAAHWAAHNVCYGYVGTKRFCHPVVGDLTVESTSLAAETGYTVLVYTAASDSPSAHAVKSLAIWRHSTAPERL
jgi:MmyB-like transcription regulator ligand binding domain